MLARRSAFLVSRRATVALAGSGGTFKYGGMMMTMPSSSSSSSSALTVQRRAFIGETTVANLAVHATQVGGCVQLSTLMYSPLGTAMLVVLAYNVVVICTKHINYSMEITAKDYVQDQQLYVIMRYGILACMLLGMEVMFIEV